MPFGLKNAPQIYQRLLDNALYGFLKLTPEHEQDGRPDVFDRPVPEDRSAKPAIGRRSFIDDILVAGSTWEEMCIKLERLMEACEKWGLSISLPKSVFGVSRVDYLGHSVSADGVKANPKNLEELQRLEFPKTLKGIQSFLGSLNFYHKFIEHFAVYAAALYEVTAADLAADQEDHDRLKAAKVAFEALKSKLVEAPILRHYETDRRSTIVVYANDWSVAGSLMQDWDGELHPVRFFSRVLKPHELRFSPAEKEALALLRVLDGSTHLLVGRPIRVVTRFSNLQWLLKAKGLQGRLQVWSALLSPWTLEIVRATKDEDHLTGLVAAAIGPADRLDEMLSSIRPRKAIPSTRYQLPLPTIPTDSTAWVASFDGSAKPKNGGASCGALLWQTPSWSVKAAEGRFFEGGTVNEAEYRGAIACLELALAHEVKELVVCGDSRIVIQQLRGEIECRTPGLQVLLAEALKLLRKFDKVFLVHVARAYNAAADWITGKTLQRRTGDCANEARLTAIPRERTQPRVEQATIDSKPTPPDVRQGAVDPRPTHPDAGQGASEMPPTEEKPSGTAINAKPSHLWKETVKE
ncbi:hypothetical protein P43SY_012144 [Pythium insidiosum]|uniref:Reverse transcriptase domain-containing protein n=1 Tax=Pythium insidiosum TaxID=114742 RepID=A0AAD5LS44_PYTIN|nr:hypothetical protein P43SY_012144 [Pythium insidiosum]